jgi:ribosomal protein S18 acetylase RimI-like enzyme
MILKEATVEDVKKFCLSAGKSLEKFRYFKNRKYSIINNHYCTFVYYKDKDPIGYCHLDIEDNILWLGICVSENHLGKGLGKLMMIKLMDAFKSQKKFYYLYLTVDKDNYKAIDLYNKFGFYIIDKKEKYFKMRLSNDTCLST